MITRLGTVGIWVLDQQRAKEFYTDKLGFEVRTEMRGGEGFSWLTVGLRALADVEILLGEPGPPMVDEESGAQLRALVA